MARSAASAPCRAAPNPRRPTRKRHIGTVRQVAFAAAAGLAPLHPVLAADTITPQITHLSGSNQSLPADLVLLCGPGQPRFKNVNTGKILPIINAQIRAVAEKACHPSLGATEGSGDVNIVNRTGKTIYVGFAPQSGSQITWGSKCGSPVQGTTVRLAPDVTCQASVSDSVASPGSRFCAATSVGASGALNCAMAQQQNRTLIEPYFQPAPCVGYNAGCIWYDISVIPSNCTDAAWAANRCANTGGAAYNLPVRLACTGPIAEPTYTCRGPAGSKYGSAGYPSNCGNPEAACIPGPSGNPACVNAYFYPDDNSHGQPNSVCPNGQTLTITFLAGP